MKRSAQVALVLMSAASVGGIAYSMMPRQDCVPPRGALPSGGTLPNSALPNTSPSGTSPSAGRPTCGSSHSSSSWFHSGRPLFGWSSSRNLTSTTNTTRTTTARTAFGGTARGGFGGTFASFGSRGS
jgi:hypothetical protein